MPRQKKVRRFGLWSYGVLCHLLSPRYFSHAIWKHAFIDDGYPFSYIIYTEYSDDSCLIPKNTSLIIARVPLTIRQSKKSWDPSAEKNAAAARANKNPDAPAGNIDLTQMNGTEEEKINAMMKQSTMDYDPRQ